MKFKKIAVNSVSALLLLFMGTVSTHAETNQSNAQQQLQQSDTNIQAKEQEKNRLQQQVQSMQQDLSNVNSSIAKTKGDLEKTQKDIDQTNQLIEQKKEEIVHLEDKVAARKDVMKQRMVSVQNNDSTNVIIDILVNSNNLGDIIDKMGAVATILDSDKEILKLQQDDLAKIEKDKQDIKQKETALEADRAKLAKSQADLESDMQKKQQALQDVQKQYSDVSSQLNLAVQEKQSIEDSIKSMQNTITSDQAAVNASKVSNNTPSSPAPSGGRELYVKATAYSVEKSMKIGEGVSSIGISLKGCPKVIAVDPSIIPLGKHVWVDGYGEFIAGDTGGDIKNNRIDVLVPTEADASNFGVKYVKVIVLD
ncbi:3D domain-containing protein [Ectobacillus polymachus]|uniref:PcsB-like coiled-coil domain-containing protein n=1 Tax=Ectobacillus polymachus TaxID=1508806 RepID=UPI003A88FA5C